MQLTTFVNPETAPHVMEEMPFSHGCHGPVTELEETVGRLVAVRGACQAVSVQSIM